MQKELTEHQKDILRDIEQKMQNSDGCVLIMVCLNGLGTDASSGRVNPKMSLAAAERAIMQSKRIAARMQKHTQDSTATPTTTAAATAH